MATRGSARLWTAGGALAATVLGVGTWLAVVSPQLSDAQSLRSQIDGAQVQNAVLQGQLDRLQAQQRQLPQLRQQLSAAAAALPPQPALARFTDQVQRRAAASSVTVSAVVAGQPAVAGGTPAAAAASTAAPAGASSPAAAPSAAASSSATGMYALPVSVVVSGRWSGDVAFLRGLQYGGPRAVLVTSVDVGSATGSSPGQAGQVAMTVQCTLFVSVPAAPAAPAVTPSTAPAPQAAPAGS